MLVVETSPKPAEKMPPMTQSCNVERHDGAKHSLQSY